jgi:hypothetical protein
VINHALAGLPEDQVRFHVCWGSGHRPHVNDVPLKDIADLLVKVNATAYSVEAGCACGPCRPGLRAMAELCRSRQRRRAAVASPV